MGAIEISLLIYLVTKTPRGPPDPVVVGERKGIPDARRTTPRSSRGDALLFQRHRRPGWQLPPPPRAAAVPRRFRPREDRRSRQRPFRRSRREWRQGRSGVGARAPDLGEALGQDPAGFAGGLGSREARRGRLGRDLPADGGRHLSAGRPGPSPRSPAGAGGGPFPGILRRRRLSRRRDESRLPRPPWRRAGTGRPGEGALLPPSRRRPG